MNMKMKGWIKFTRLEADLLKSRSDREFRYYVMARLDCIWDKRNSLYGTFDGRIREVKKSLLPGWSIGKISTTAAALIKRGLLEKTDDTRRMRVNAPEGFLQRPPKPEINVQGPEKDVQPNENELQKIEQTKGAIRKKLGKEPQSVANILARKFNLPNTHDSKEI